jgi:hypothetical protein
MFASYVNCRYILGIIFLCVFSLYNFSSVVHVNVCFSLLHIWIKSFKFSFQLSFTSFTWIMWVCLFPLLYMNLLCQRCLFFNNSLSYLHILRFFFFVSLQRVVNAKKEKLFSPLALIYLRCFLPFFLLQCRSYCIC